MSVWLIKSKTKQSLSSKFYQKFQNSLQIINQYQHWQKTLKKSKFFHLFTSYFVFLQVDYYLVWQELVLNFLHILEFHKDAHLHLEETSIYVYHLKHGQFQAFQMEYWLTFLQDMRCYFESLYLVDCLLVCYSQVSRELQVER